MTGSNIKELDSGGRWEGFLKNKKKIGMAAGIAAAVLLLIIIIIVAVVVSTNITDPPPGKDFPLSAKAYNKKNSQFFNR